MLVEWEEALQQKGEVKIAWTESNVIKSIFKKSRFTKRNQKHKI